MPRRLWRSMLVALILALLLAPAVAAHAALESATPGPGNEVVGSPPELVTRFSQNLDPSRTVLEVRDSAGTRIARGGEPGDDEREFRLALPELAPGEYEVRWTSFSSEDQELARDSYTFTVLAAPSPTPSATPDPTARPSSTPTAAPSATATVVPTPQPSEPTTPSTSPSTLEMAVPIAASALVVAVAAVWLLRRKRP